MRGEDSAGDRITDVFLVPIPGGVGKYQSRDRSQGRGQNSGVKKYPRGHNSRGGDRTQGGERTQRAEIDPRLGRE